MSRNKSGHDASFEIMIADTLRRYKGEIPPAPEKVECSICKKESIKKKPLSIVWIYDPFMREIHEKYEWRYLCRECYLSSCEST